MFPRKRSKRRDEDAEPTTAESLAVLAEYRRTGARNSQDVVKRGERILQEKGALKRMRDEVWPFLEQLGFAAVDTGNNDLASICIQRLEEKFPGSPRVDALYGLLVEIESADKAREFYEKKLAENENNVVVRKRLISLHLHSEGTDTPSSSLSVQKGIEMLVDHLETVYNDPEAWLELANAYERLGLLQQCLSCVGDLILLQPTNTFHVLRHAEINYTLGEYTQAYREFCRALEMAGPMDKGGLGRRAGFGIKMCLQRLPSLPATSSSSKKEVVKPTPGDVASPAKAKDIDALVTEELLKAYRKNWLEVGDRVAGHDENRVLKAWLAQHGSSDAVAVR